MAAIGTGCRTISEDIRLVKDSSATSSSGKVTIFLYEVAFLKNAIPGPKWHFLEKYFSKSAFYNLLWRL